MKILLPQWGECKCCDGVHPVEQVVHEQLVTENKSIEWKTLTFTRLHKFERIATSWVGFISVRGSWFSTFRTERTYLDNAWTQTERRITICQPKPPLSFGLTLVRELRWTVSRQLSVTRIGKLYHTLRSVWRHRRSAPRRLAAREITNCFQLTQRAPRNDLQRNNCEKLPTYTVANKACKRNGKKPNEQRSNIHIQMRHKRRVPKFWCALWIPSDTERK